jgi:hypothetical protein
LTSRGFTEGAGLIVGTRLGALGIGSVFGSAGYELDTPANGLPTSALAAPHARKDAQETSTAKTLIAFI